MEKYRTEEEQLAAVKQNGNAIQFVKNPSELVRLAAVKNNGYAIRFIKKPLRILGAENCFRHLSDNNLRIGGNDHGSQDVCQNAGAAHHAEDRPSQADNGGVNSKILTDAAANATNHLILIGFIQFLFHCKVPPENSNSCTKVLFSSAA